MPERKRFFSIDVFPYSGAISKWAKAKPWPVTHNHDAVLLLNIHAYQVAAWRGHNSHQRRSQVMQNHGLPWPLPWPSPIAVTFRPWAQIQIQMQKADTNTNTNRNENTNRLTTTPRQAEPCLQLHSVLGSKWPAIKIGLWVMNYLSTPLHQNLSHLKNSCKLN